MADPLLSARDYIAQQRERLETIVLGTATAAGEPDASVVATVLDARGAFAICVSGLTARTRNLRENPRASVLLADPAPAAGSPFARRRLTFACQGEHVARADPGHASLLDALRQRFGAVVDTVAGLPDFEVIRLVPTRGRVVVGFGAAFHVDPADWTRLTPIGPR